MAIMVDHCNCYCYKAVYLPRSSLIVYCYSVFISIVTVLPFITILSQNSDNWQKKKKKKKKKGK